MWFTSTITSQVTGCKDRVLQQTIDRLRRSLSRC